MQGKTISHLQNGNHTGKLIRKAIKKHIQYVRSDLGYVDGYLSEGIVLTENHILRLEVIRKVYEQQKYMYERGIHSVPDRIISISQPFFRSIV